jgi:hypothetical protein
MGERLCRENVHTYLMREFCRDTVAIGATLSLFVQFVKF